VEGCGGRDSKARLSDPGRAGSIEASMAEH
jgi:hypothetical protein